MLDCISRVRVRADARGVPGHFPRAADSVPRLGERGVPGEERRRARECRRHRLRIRPVDCTRRDVPDSGKTLEFLPLANEVWGEVMCSHLFVILFTRGCIPAYNDGVYRHPLGKHPLGRHPFGRHPPRQAFLGQTTPS